MAGLARGLFLAAVVLLPLGAASPAPALHPRLQWSDLLLAAAAPLWLATSWRTWRPRGVHAAYAVYLASAGVAWWLSGAPLAGAVKLAGIGSLVVLAILTADSARDPRGAERVGRAVALAAALAGVAALAGTGLGLAGIPTPLLGSQGDLVPGDYPRARGLLAHPNLLGSFCIAAVGVVASPRAALPRPLVRALVALLAAASLASLSRSALCLAVALALGRARGRAGRAVAAGLAALVLLALGALSFGNLRLDPTRPWEATWSASPSPRRQALESAAQTLRAHPLGIGPGGVPARVDGRPFEAHCTLLNVGATLGLPAAAALVAIPVALWRRRARPDPAAWGALAGLALDSLAQDAEDFRHFWLLLGWLDAERRPS